jgi:hypothetical protein
MSGKKNASRLLQHFVLRNDKRAGVQTGDCFGVSRLAIFTE